MKAALLSLIFALAFTASNCVANSYPAMKDAYKESLYANQARLMPSKSTYFAFIEPYMKELERQSAIVSYCMMREGNDQLFARFFYYLFNYNVAMLEHYVHPNSFVIAYEVNRTKKELLDAIYTIKRADMPTLDEWKEIKDITDLLTKANEAYYKQLPWNKRLLLKLS